VWLGRPFGLPAAVTDAIVLGNVLGLAVIRLRDDLADGEIDAPDVAHAEELSGALYREALLPYRDLLPDHAEFWGRLDAWMTEWAGRESATGADLARRGAPLKISAYAVCLLSDSKRDFPAIEACLDHALTGMVLYDDACDWEADLLAGRANAFVTSTLGTLPRADGRNASRAGVLAALIASPASAPHFAMIAEELGSAASIAAGLGLGELDAFLVGLRAEIERQATALDAHYRHLGEIAEAVMFGEVAAATGAERRRQ
jgi:hypothetical protein